MHLENSPVRILFTTQGRPISLHFSPITTSNIILPSTRYASQVFPNFHVFRPKLACDSHLIRVAHSSPVFIWSAHQHIMGILFQELKYCYLFLYIICDTSIKYTKNKEYFMLLKQFQIYNTMYKHTNTFRLCVHINSIQSRTIYTIY